MPEGTEVLAGEGALAAIATDADIVLNGVVGFEGLPVTLAALTAGRRLALANKESLIAGGPVVLAGAENPRSGDSPRRFRALCRPSMPAGIADQQNFRKWPNRVTADPADRVRWAFPGQVASRAV